MSKYIDAEKLYKQVDSLMARYAKNEEEFEVDDEELSIFYQGKRKMCSEVLKIIDFLQQEQLLGIEEYGVPGKDFIPVEWVDACEKYGKWKIVQQEQLSLLDNLDEAAEEWCKRNNKGIALCGDKKSHYLTEGVDAFKAGAEWMAGQGYTVDGAVICDKELTRGYKDIAMSIPDELKADDKVTVQIRKRQ